MLNIYIYIYIFIREDMVNIWFRFVVSFLLGFEFVMLTNHDRT